MEAFPTTSLYSIGPYQLCYGRIHYYELFSTRNSVGFFIIRLGRWVQPIYHSSLCVSVFCHGWHRSVDMIFLVLTAEWLA